MTADRGLRSRLWLAVVAGGLLVVGCGLLPTTGPAAHFDNVTNTPMAVHVKGVWAGTFAPGASADVRLAGYGAPPYLVSVHSPSGIVLVELEVSADDLRVAAEGSGGTSGSAEFPCGTVRITVGRTTEPIPAIPFAQMPACP